MGPVITAHPVQLACAAACADVYLREGDLAPARRGVAYLIQPDRAMTSATATEGVRVGATLQLRFSGGARTAILLSRDEESDCALLALSPPMVSQLSLSLSRDLPARGDACQTWAAVPTMTAAGQLLQALVQEPLGEDAQGAPTLMLRLVAGGERWHASLTGSPLLHRGYVVGHLRTLTHGAGESRLLACPAVHVAALDEEAGGSSAPRAVQPPGAAYNARWYIPRPVDEHHALAALDAPGRPLVLSVPSGGGKSWFVTHLLDRLAYGENMAVARIACDRLPVAARGSLEDWLGAALTVARPQLHGASGRSQPVLPVLAAGPRAQRRGLHSAVAATVWMETVLAALAPRRACVAFDGLDALQDALFVNALLQTLGDWLARAAHEGTWSQLRLIFTMSSSPDWLCRPWYPATLQAPPMSLHELSLEQLRELAELHRLPVRDEELRALWTLVGGHAYLARLAMFAALQRRQTLGDTIRPRPGLASVFDAHLDAVRGRVLAQPGLWLTLDRVLRRQQTDALDQLMLPRLERIGILRRVGRPDGTTDYVLRHPIYRGLIDT